VEQLDAVRRTRVDDRVMHVAMRSHGAHWNGGVVDRLASVIRSGVTPKYSAAVALPSRPKPVMTSSKISRMPCFVQISRSFADNPAAARAAR